MRSYGCGRPTHLRFRGLEPPASKHSLGGRPHLFPVFTSYQIMLLCDSLRSLRLPEWQSNPRPLIKGSAVALHCCNEHSKINKKMEMSPPPHRRIATATALNVMACVHTDASRSWVSVRDEADRTVQRSSNWSLYWPLESLTIVSWSGIPKRIHF